jgi:S1-C subfamily serine protease
VADAILLSEGEKPMRKPALRLIVFLAAAACTVNAQTQNTTEELVKKSSDAVVLIFVSDSGKDTGLGSGFIISSDGKIVTNYHVIKGADKALVKLTNGAFFPVETVLASDPVSDLAIIKVAGRNLPTLKLGNSGTVQAGERVVAIGNPLGLETTVTDGIVSALRNEASASWIQTTAPVSPGNSGGPLLRLDGTVVGVITWNLKLGQNLNFAATSNEVSTLLEKPTNAKPLTADEKGVELPSGRIWTSLSSGKDYKLRLDGDYIYTEWANIPSAWGPSAFGRGELKKAGAIWSGHQRNQFPCQYGVRINWITVDVEMEITSLTATRIEGRAKNYQGFNCRSKSPKGEATWAAFTWIPKD